jgi:hypothetical protein
MCDADSGQRNEVRALHQRDLTEPCKRFEVSFRAERGICFLQEARKKQILLARIARRGGGPRANPALGMTSFQLASPEC